MSELEKIKVEAGQNEGAEPMTDEQAKKPKLKLAPVTVGDPKAASSMAIDQQHMEEFASAEESPSTIECQRPPKGTFFTVRAETTRPWQDRAFYFFAIR
jgi:hypothetical protein